MKISMQRYGDFGWEFSIITTDELTDKEVTQHFRTNGMGSGLWELRRTSANWADGSPVMEYHQISGTCQFGLAERRKPAYDKIRREFRRHD